MAARAIVRPIAPVPATLLEDRVRRVLDHGPGDRVRAGAVRGVNDVAGPGAELCLVGVGGAAVDGGNAGTAVVEVGLERGALAAGRVLERGGKEGAMLRRATTS